MINLNGEERFFFLKKKDTALDEILHSGTSKYFHLSEALQHEQFEKKKKILWIGMIEAMRSIASRHR